MQSTRGAAILAAVAVLTSGLAACGDNSEPQESTTTASPIDRSTESPSSSKSSSSSESETSSGDGLGDGAELPEEAKAQTKEGAMAFNEFFQVQSGEALTISDPAVVRQHSSDCPPCDAFADSVDTHAKNGTKMNRNPYTVRDVSARKRDDGGYRVQMRIDVKEYHEVLKDGSKGRTAKAMSMTMVTNTQWASDRWVIRDIVRTK